MKQKLINIFICNNIGVNGGGGGVGGVGGLHGNLELLVDIKKDEKKDLWIESSSLCGYIIDLKNYLISISSFTLKHFCQDCCYPYSFKIEGSNNGIEWETLQIFIDPNFNIFNSPNQSKTFKIQNENQNRFFRFFRILNFQKNSSNNWNFGISFIEFYGKLTKLNKF